MNLKLHTNVVLTNVIVMYEFQGHSTLSYRDIEDQTFDDVTSGCNMFRLGLG